MFNLSRFLLVTLSGIVAIHAQCLTKASINSQSSLLELIGTIPITGGSKLAVFAPPYAGVDGGVMYTLNQPPELAQTKEYFTCVAFGSVLGHDYKAPASPPRVAPGEKAVTDNHNRLWAITGAGNIWRTTSPFPYAMSAAKRTLDYEWVAVPGHATYIAADVNRPVWVIDSPSPGQDGSIYKWTGAGWAQAPNAGSRSLSLDADGLPWAVTAGGDVYSFDSVGVWNARPVDKPASLRLKAPSLIRSVLLDNASRPLVVNEFVAGKQYFSIKTASGWKIDQRAESVTGLAATEFRGGLVILQQRGVVTLAQ